MSEIKALEELRELIICDKGEKYTAYLDAGNIADEIEAEIAECYMLAPVDADGVPIHMGDAIEGKLLDDSTVRGTVCAFHLYDDEPDSVYIHVDVSSGGWTIKELRLTRCRHYKLRTLEEVLEEFADAAADVDERDREEWEPLLDRYADEIREIMGGKE